MLQFEDKYVRDYAFEPEILHERKDSIAVQRHKFHHKRLQQKRRSYRNYPSLYLRLPKTIRENESENNNNHNTLNVVSGNEDTISCCTVLDELEETTELEKGVEEFYYVSVVCVCLLTAFDDDLFTF